MTPTRKPRSPGQRQFNPTGSPRDWDKVMKSPHVQRALRDPGIRSALYQNFKQTGGQVPEPSEAPARFADGGSMADIDAQIKQETDNLQAAANSGDRKAIDAATTKLAELNKKRTAATMAMTQPPASFGNTQVSGSTMQGLQRLGQQGPPTLGNMAANIGLGAVMGGGSTGRGSGALIGAATAGLLNYFIRKNAQKQQQQRQRQSDITGGFQGDRNTPATGLAATPTSAPPTPAPQVAPPPPMPDGPGLFHGTANLGRGSGNVISSDGQNWVDADTRQPVPANTTVANQEPLKKFDSPDVQSLPAPSQVPDLKTMGSKLATVEPDDEEDDDELAKGGPVPSGLKAHGMPIPILHTTIVIAAKPKKGAKAEKPVKRSMGGDIPQSERRPRRPHAIPPLAGPESSGARLPHGRVQVPRGSGAAIKGKRFGGVF